MKTIRKPFGTILGPVRASLACAAFALATQAGAQQAFPSPAAAADAFVDAVARNDDVQVKKILGPDFRKYIPAGSTSSVDKTQFLEAWARGHKIVASGDSRATLEVGTSGWTLPIPIVKAGDGWKFDARSAPMEMRKRRIGRNELAAMQVALAYSDAQEEYYAKNPDRAPAKHYAMRALSSPGKRDGLYWVSTRASDESPLGPQFAAAKRGQAYHGYLYRILTAQGKDAPGGAKSYMRDGRLTDGYALVAWPERYGETGVMTFIVNRDGIVYEKNLGPKTDAMARAMTAYNPDASWSKAKTK